MKKLVFKYKDKMSHSEIYIVKKQGVCHIGDKRRGDKHGLLKKKKKNTELRGKRPGCN